MKKRYWAMAIIGVELLALPATAQMLDRVSFTVPQRAVHVEFPEEPGLQRMFISSNAPFSITSEGVVGDYQVTVIPTGVIGGQSFGANAQLPGEAETCSTAIGTEPAMIYKAFQKTAKTRGGPVTQAVLVEIRYDRSLSPEFDVLTEDKSEHLSLPAPCQTTIS